MRNVAKFVEELHEYIGRAVAPLVARLKAIEDRPAPVIAAAVKGDKGDPGADAVIDRDLVVAVVKEISAGLFDGLLINLDARIAALIPAPVKGDKGDPGSDAVVEHDQVVKAAEEVLGQMRDSFLLEFERRGMDSITRQIDQALARITQPKDGRDGIDGLGFNDLQCDYDGDRALTLRFERDGLTKQFVYALPIVIDRGYYREGRSFEKGDAVTADGCLWIALKKTDVKPSTSAKDDWRLAVRKGRDGLDGKNGRDAPSVVALNAR